MVGEGRFELPASCSQSRRAAKLRHSPETASVAVVVTVSGPTLPRMPTEPVIPELLEPVSVRSRLVRAAGVRYTEVAGAAVVWEPSRRALHELSPAAAALWAALDGRPFGDVISEATAPSDAPTTTERDLIEAVRRLRALRLVSDLGPDQSPVADLESHGVPPDRVEL